MQDLGFSSKVAEDAEVAGCDGVDVVDDGGAVEEVDGP